MPPSSSSSSPVTQALSNALGRALAIRRVPLSSLTLDPANARRHPDRNLDSIKASLARFGQVEPLIVLKPSGRVIGGNGRLVAMKALGWSECDVVELELSDLDATALGIALNRTAELAEWDDQALSQILSTLRDESALEGVGYEVDEIQDIIDAAVAARESLDGITQDAAPLLPDAATTRSGDLWVLGNHRLLCGDSSKRDDLDRLLAGAKIQLVNTDPPYNVKVEPRSNNAIAAGLSSFGTTHHQGLDLARHPGKAKATDAKLRPKDRPLANDFVSDEEFARLLRAWFANASYALEPGRAFYIWGGYANLANYPAALAENELYFSQAIVWNKLHPVLTRKDFMGAFELCQPAGTQVLTPDGDVPIESLTDADRVVAFNPHNNCMSGVRHGAAIRSTSRPYTGRMLGVRVGGRTTWCTPGHLWSARLAPEADQMWCVYLMKKGNWWRAGKSRLITSWGFGLKQRVYTEGAEAAWILSIHTSSVDAALQEQFVLAKYGVPLTTWSESGAALRTIADVRMLYDRLDLSVLRDGALRALRDHGREPEFPLVTDQRTRVKVSRRIPTLVRACNVVPEVMLVPVPEQRLHVRWEPVAAIEETPFSGDVYSMDVDKHGHYVADGIVTHNCFYGWREGAAHLYLGPANATDLWEVKKVNPQSMVHLTEKPVELAARAMQYSSRPGERVLDLFGGSGSTLIAAEQTGRRAFLIELDALYCDVIVERWQRLTGQAATLDGENKSFADVRKERAQ